MRGHLFTGIELKRVVNEEGFLCSYSTISVPKRATVDECRMMNEASIWVLLALRAGGGQCDL
jgi:hypothetical protein